MEYELLERDQESTTICLAPGCSSTTNCLVYGSPEAARTATSGSASSGKLASTSTFRKEKSKEASSLDGPATNSSTVAYPCSEDQVCTVAPSSSKSFSPNWSTTAS
eukprot:gnl/TRDRNA2_/TRDRNA2_71479_c1_seq2.p2 gnl/TRDRNA2_/TRDRNA2_71479_c1~~gnl/TRDRNA2_/TRDRNA2_71479_c1_seq2.p2  ORF type:complete len:106 (+),score=14.08 gnl/TRDRNA2_/TRDRNA2_71479_c1_seq2:288-605(+)